MNNNNWGDFDERIMDAQSEEIRKLESELHPQKGEPKIIKSWSDFDGQRTDSFALDSWGKHIDAYRIKPSIKLMRFIFNDDKDIPEAILILNSLGFNFRLDGE